MGKEVHLPLGMAEKVKKKIETFFFFYDIFGILNVLPPLSTGVNSHIIIIILFLLFLLLLNSCVFLL